MASKLTLPLAIVAGLLAASAGAQSDSGLTARAARVAEDTAQVRGLYDVRMLQAYYSQFAQFGLWDEMAELFADEGELIDGDTRIEGKAAIASWLADRYGDGEAGLPAGRMALLLPFSPIANLAADGRHAEVRWHEFSLLGGGDVEASWEGGVYENDYVLEDGRWKIASQHYHPTVAGTYADGWVVVHDDVPVVPYHYTPDSAGIPVPSMALGPAEAAAAAGADSAGADAAEVVASVAGPIAQMRAENEIRNLQNIYGYYADRRMWDDVADLFADGGTLDIAGVGRWTGRDSIRRGVEREGPAGLPAGVLNDHLIFPVIVTLGPDGNRAQARGIELAMQGEVDANGYWSASTFENTFAKQDGVWTIETMRLYPQMRADVAVGWGESRLDPVMAGEASRPDGRSASALAAVPAFSYTHPVTGEPVALAPRGRSVAAAASLTGARAPSPAGDAEGLLDAAALELRRLVADVGTINMSNAFGNYIDDFEWEMLGASFAEKGAREMPFAGFFIGPERIATAEITKWGHRRSPRRSIPVHLRMQPVVDVSADGRSTRFRTRLFSYFGSTRPGSFNGGMYANDQAVLEDGSWKLWSVAIDEFYMRTGGLGNWWVKLRPEPVEKNPDMLLEAYPPDIPLTALGQRQQGFKPGMTEFNPDHHNGPAYPGFPSATPMWFHYVNPVSGRVPEYYWPDCVTCEAFPETSLAANGY